MEGKLSAHEATSATKISNLEKRLAEAEKKFEKNTAPVVKKSTEAPVPAPAPAPSPVAVVAGPPSPTPTPPPEDQKIAEMQAKVESSKRTIIEIWANFDTAALSRKTTTECRQFLNVLGISTKNSWGVELQKKDLISKVGEVVSMEVGN